MHTRLLKLKNKWSWISKEKSIGPQSNIHTFQRQTVSYYLIYISWIIKNLHYTNSLYHYNQFLFQNSLHVGRKNCINRWRCWCITASNGCEPFITLPRARPLTKTSNWISLEQLSFTIILNQNIALIWLQHKNFHNTQKNLQTTHCMFQRKIVDFSKFLNY